MPLQDLQNGTHSFDPRTSNDDFMEQMLYGLQPGVPWPDISTSTGAGDGSVLFDDQSTLLTIKLRQHQISAGNSGAGIPSSAAKSQLLQQQFLLGLTGAGDSGLFENETVDARSFNSPIGDSSIQAVLNGFTGSLQTNQPHNVRYSSAPSFGSPVPAVTPVHQGLTSVGATVTAGGGGGGGPLAQPRQRVRARRGQATDPHSIAERLRRERISERMKSLQELVPNANKTDKASMLDEIIDYVKFLQLQVKILSMSRMGGVAAVAPLVADTSSEGARDGVQAGAGVGATRSSTGIASSSNNDSMTIAENQVVKLMEEDMGSAMQYLQGKGLCLMPISLATAISTTTATCHIPSARNNHPSSANLSMLSVKSANGLMPPEMVSVKDLTSGSKSNAFRR